MRNVATFPQAKHLIQLFEPLDSGQLQRLYASGLLSDVLRSALEHDPIMVDRNKLQSALGFDPFTFRVRMGDNANTNQIMAKLDCPFDSRITQDNFSLKIGAVPREDTIRILDPGRGFSEEKGLRFLAERRIGRPTYEHAIRFVEQCCKATSSKKKRFVVFLHPSWNDQDGHRCVMVFDRYPEVQRLALFRLTKPFNDDCVLAGVFPAE
jgi:hypothetical protein